VQILPGEERELADMLADYLREEGIEIHTQAPVVRVEQEGAEKVVVARINGQERRFKGSEILLAAGRHPRTADLALGNVGVQTNGPAIVVDSELRTSTPHVWAIGDVTGGYMYTHVATYEGPYAALNAVKNLGRKADHRVVPRAVFTSPALASVGLTEDAAQAAGYAVKTGTFPFAWSGKAKAIGDTRGKIKVVVNTENEEILGFHVLGPDGDNLIHEAVVAMYNPRTERSRSDGTVEPITKSIHIHPTLAEAVKSAAKTVG
jgi:pyruvate/2-oxoglutarate dehydrogenase complex dihydrolipoamide dehydrogenase (E3) component